MQSHPLPSQYMIFATPLLRLLRRLLRGLAVQPQSYEDNPARHGGSDTCDPRPGSRDDKTPWPLIVRKMPDRHRPLFEDVAQEGALVVDQEIEDAVLIRQAERSGEDSAVFCGRLLVKPETVEWRKHAELKLHLICSLRLIWLVVVNVPL